jgi:hypothetical protein
MGQLIVRQFLITPKALANLIVKQFRITPKVLTNFSPGLERSDNPGNERKMTSKP